MSIEWNVHIFDKPGVDRTPFRPQHLADIPGNVNAGVVVAAGPLYQDVEKTKFVGSGFILNASLKEEIKEFLSRDIFAKEGIWDMDLIVAYPTATGVRLAKDMAGVNVK